MQASALGTLTETLFPLPENTIDNLKLAGLGLFLLIGVILGCLICAYHNLGLRTALIILVAIWPLILIFGRPLSVQKA